MGRIFSPPKPKASSPQVIYYPQTSAATAASTSSSATTAADTAADSQTKTESDVSTERAENILRRNRSRLGTVLTSFRGILSQGTLSAPRKTLLGE